MRAKATFAGEPVHPMFVHYPIALWTTSVITDVIFYFNRNPSLVLISKFLIAAGIVGAVLSAIPGLIDWTGISEPVAKTTGTRHLVLNVLALVLFCVSLYLRMKELRRAARRFSPENSIRGLRDWVDTDGYLRQSRRKIG